MVIVVVLPGCDGADYSNAVDFAVFAGLVV